MEKGGIPRTSKTFVDNFATKSLNYIIRVNIVKFGWWFTTLSLQYGKSMLNEVLK